MGRYRLGDIIRMTRKSLSITQEQLCDGICSVESLSRMETGKQNPSKDIYELLMERMGRIRERAYSMLSVSDYQVLDKMKQFDNSLRVYDYSRAEQLLNDIKRTLGNSILDQQFIIRADCIINYRLNKINAEEYLKRLKKAISLTIPQFETISLLNWPLNYNESWILLNMSTAYAEINDLEKAVVILEETNNALEQSYMDEQQRIILQVTNLVNLSKWYGLLGNHEKAIEVASKGLLLCKKHRIGSVLPYLFYSIAWNKERLIEMGVLPPEDKRECISNLKQAYYFATVMQTPVLVQFIKKHISEFYDESANIILD